MDYTADSKEKQLNSGEAVTVWIHRKSTIKWTMNALPLQVSSTALVQTLDPKMLQLNHLVAKRRNSGCK